MSDLPHMSNDIETSSLNEQQIPRLELINISKSYNSLKANDSIGLTH